jgi:hypothetical protein
MKFEKQPRFVNNRNTIHTSRTIMYTELEKVMAHSVDTGLYLEAMGENVFGKKSSDGVVRTIGFLKQLYGFELNNPAFIAFEYFWRISDSHERPLIAFLYAVNHDFLLAESIDVVQKVTPGTKVTTELFEEVIERNHPNRYSVNTRKSMAQNIASSWKQAGFIEGKIRNIRTEPEITHGVACFAFFLAYLNGERGNFIWNSTGVKALCLPESRLRELAVECARKDFMQYQYAGGITAINFANLSRKIGIHGNTN